MGTCRMIISQIRFVQTYKKHISRVSSKNDHHVFQKNTISLKTNKQFELCDQTPWSPPGIFSPLAQTIQVGLCLGEEGERAKGPGNSMI